MSNFWFIALAILIIIVAYMLFNRYLNKKAVIELNQNEFHNGLRKAQVIDVREKADYDYGHINGARNIPIIMINQSCQCLNTDLPIYLCDAKGNASYRAARILKKKVYKDIYMLKGGYKKWTGKIKSKK